jgi:valyl-tRNA synthetase
MPQLPKTYDPAAVEAAAYQTWIDEKAFHADPAAGGRPYTIVIPPPNVTGALHLGHAIDGTLQDILIRRKRMQGFNTLWMPGIDHAGIATQAVVEKELKEKENKNRHDIGREALVQRIWQWKEQYGNRIIEQLKRLGASCDWDRTRFTLDEVCARAVRETFFKLFKDGLIYRGQRLVNWDVQLQTAVADDEIFHETVKGGFWTFRYPVKDSSEFIRFSTTRPETMLGDTAVAVHPDDPRYKHLIGKNVLLPLVQREVPIIADEQLVDPKLGTGAVKVTPAHDPNDYAAWQRQKGGIGIINILTPDGKINENGGKYAGLSRHAARERVTQDMDKLGLFEGREDREIPLAHSDRSKTPIEPYLSDQWFVRMGDGESTQSRDHHSRDDQSRDHQSRDRKGATPNAPTPDTPPHSNALAYFITFHTFATWLHGEEPGSVDPQHNDYDAPFIPPDPRLVELKRTKTEHPALELTVAQRQVVLKAIEEVAAYRGWLLQAVNVRSTHVHAVVSGPAAPERMMNDFKSYATRRMVEAGLLEPNTKAWSRHGSTKDLWKDHQLAGASHYTLHEQGENPPGTAFDVHGQSEPRPSGSDFGLSTVSGSLPYGRGSDGSFSGLAQTAIDAVADGRVKFFPDRYAKTYLDWLGEKRDWCISRQLWWGHRIPVWTLQLGAPGGRPIDAHEFSRLHQTLCRLIHDAGMSGSICSREDYNTHRFVLCARDDAGSLFLDDLRQFWDVGLRPMDAARPPSSVWFRDDEHLTALANPFTGLFSSLEQDPDVLDTWFSSALWPHSTLGWPEQTPELQFYYPTNVLLTAREIITLWVARMVIAGLYNMGDVPFAHVYIHPTILDGKGERMSKSKGNGVDPVDIIESYGADALRFTLTQMATETQDVRMPTKKDARGRNTSEKFEAGRNFCNKLWNAARFALTNLSDEGQKPEAPNPKPETRSLADRWILSRLARTIETIDQALDEYHFDVYARACYDFFWRDLCDWYIESIKPELKSGAPRRGIVAQVLTTALDGALRLMHPMIPFVTEAIWAKLHEVAPNRAGAHPRLIKARWPEADRAQIDEPAETDFARLQEIVSAIRNLRNDHKVDPRTTVKVTISGDALGAVQQNAATVELLAGCALNFAQAQAGPGARASAGGCEILVEDLVDQNAEQARSAKRREELTRQIAALRGRLANASYTAKAPPHLVQQTRDQLAAAENELAKL